MDSGKTAFAEICVGGSGRVSTNSGSDVRKWDQPLTISKPYSNLP